MLNSRMGPAAVRCATLAACALLSGCGSEDTAESRSGGETAAARDTAVSTAAADVTVVIHMTGLLLVVPNSQGGANVLLPDTRRVGAHVARLGFGIERRTNPRDVPRPCIKDARFFTAGICYVNLYEWELEEFGEGGEIPASAPQLPPSVLNVSTAAGGKHKAHARWLTNGEFRRQLVFRSGERGEACSLATWTYDVINEQGQKVAKTEPVANVLEWKIKNPTVRALRFRHQGTGETATVPLPQTGEVHIVLAHVPPADAEDLPPNPNPRKPSGRLPRLAPHFHAYYDMVRLPASPAKRLPDTDRRRGIPRNAEKPKTEACPVSITPVERSDTSAAEARAIGTYACMIASADPP